ncbi:hypothetical protein KUTeg_013898 [Tegillarca granosa]|uniref:Homeobox domain-containing protein n=1 Tax=Tegillarca granosa TaxID=220873 RepID=A0ABQ9EV19_TEGGR|nr:hypothetical protein KUTeg_013898 [Tegillarca granosa]
MSNKIKQRIKRKDGTKKRKLGRNPRVPFTQHQVAALEQKFRRTHYLSSMDVAELSAALNLTETRVSLHNVRHYILSTDSDLSFN